MGDFDHYMIKEIYEQPRALAATLNLGADHQIADEGVWQWRSGNF